MFCLNFLLFAGTKIVTNMNNDRLVEKIGIAKTQGNYKRGKYSFPCSKNGRSMKFEKIRQASYDLSPHALDDDDAIRRPSTYWHINLYIAHFLTDLFLLLLRLRLLLPLLCFFSHSSSIPTFFFFSSQSFFAIIFLLRLLFRQSSRIRDWHSFYAIHV